MRSTLAFVALAMMAGSTLASPVQPQGIAARFNTFEERGQYWNPMRRDATSGGSGSASGGSVTNSGGDNGTIVNGGNSC